MLPSSFSLEVQTNSIFLLICDFAVPGHFVLCRFSAVIVAYWKHNFHENLDKLYSHDRSLDGVGEQAKHLIPLQE